MKYFKEIEQIICSGEGIEPENLYEKTRLHNIVFARQLIYYFLSIFTKCTLRSLSDLYGQKHATVIHAIRAIKNYIEVDRKVRIKVNFYKAQILNRIDDFMKIEKEIELKKFEDIKNFIKECLEKNRAIDYQIIIIYNKYVELNQKF